MSLANNPFGYDPNLRYAMNSNVFPETPEGLGFQNPEDGLTNLWEYWRTIKSHLLPILLLAGGAMLVAVAVVYSLTPIYQSVASIAIEDGKQKVLSIQDVYGGPAASDYYLTQLEIIRSRDIGLRTIRKLKLWDRAEFDPRRERGSAVGKWLSDQLGMNVLKAPDWTDESLGEAVYPLYAARLKVEPGPSNRMARISFDSEDPALAAKVANAVVAGYIEADRDARYDTTRGANNWLQERASGLRERLQKSEQALQAYREQKNLISVRGETRGVSAQQMDELLPRVVAARVRVAELESAYNQAHQLKDIELGSVPEVLRNTQLADAKARETTAQLKVAELSQNYGYEHPRVVQAQGELAAARDNLKRQMNVAVSSLTREYESSRATLRILEQSLALERGRAQNVGRAEAQLGVLEREVQANRELYDLFVSRAKETDLTVDLYSSVARVIEAAQPAVAPLKPNKPKFIFIAVLLGLAAGVGAALLKEWLDNTLKGADEAEQRLHLPVLTTVPDAVTEDRRAALRQFVDLSDSLFAESIRTARTGMLLSGFDEAQRVFMVTSSVPEEGKTTVSMALALALAQNRRTLLIEADLRRPTIAKGLGLELGALGLANLVAGVARQEDCIHGLEGSDLKLMPAGDLPPNPLELLSSSRFAETIEALKSQFDVIVIDTPPVEPVSDALVVSRIATATIFVLRAGRTPYPAIRKSLIRLRRAEAKLLGLVVNRVDFSKRGAYEYHYAKEKYYGYGNGLNSKAVA